MGLGAANRKPPNWFVSRFCRRGGVIESQGIELFYSITERDGHLKEQLTKKGGTAEASLLPLQGWGVFYITNK